MHSPITSAVPSLCLDLQSFRNPLYARTTRTETRNRGKHPRPLAQRAEHYFDFDLRVYRLYSLIDLSRICRGNNGCRDIVRYGGAAPCRARHAANSRITFRPADVNPFSYMDIWYPGVLVQPAVHGRSSITPGEVCCRRVLNTQPLQADCYTCCRV